MAKEIKDKKRKASVPEGDAEKVKKVKHVAAESTEAPLKKRKATEDAATIGTKKSKSAKLNIEAAASAPNLADEIASGNPSKKSKKDRGVADAEANGTTDSKKVQARGAKESKKSKPEPVEAPSSDEEDEDVDDDDESEIDDQTEALLKGFESSGDEEDAKKEGGMQPGQNIPKVPTMNNKSRKQLKRLQDKEEPEKPGVVYIGHIPHGFYENEMKAYFTQFGTILKLRLSRNKKTGASKHYAWIQFESATVAEIVARTMDNYLLFNHILKVKLVPDEQVPEDLFKGANKRFKKVPWNKIEGRKLAQPASEETWDKRIAKEEARRVKKAEKLKEMGYEFQVPAIKSAKGVSKKKVVAAIDAGEKSPQPPQNKPRKQKKNEIYGIDVAEATRLMLEKERKDAAEKQKAKAAKERGEAAKAALDAAGEDAALSKTEEPAAVEEVEKPKEKKRKKEKKAKPAEQVESAATAPEVEEPTEKKSKKAKKDKDVDAPAMTSEAEAPKEKKKEKKRQTEEGDVPEPQVEKTKAKKAKKDKTVT